MWVTDSFTVGPAYEISDLQERIEDITELGGGIIWIHSDISLETTLEMKDGVQLDFQRHRVTMLIHTPFARFHNVRGAAVRNAEVKTYTGPNTSPYPLIELKAGTGEETSQNYVGNILVRSGSGTLEGRTKLYGSQVFNGIQLEAIDGGRVFWNTLEHIAFNGLCSTILFKVSNGGIVEANLLTDIFGQHTTNAMRFEDDEPSGLRIRYNTFRQIRFEPFESTPDNIIPARGIGPLPGFANHFDRMFMWDWLPGATSGDVTLDATTQNCYFNLDFSHKLTNNAGTSTLSTFLQSCYPTTTMPAPLVCASGSTPAPLQPKAPDRPWVDYAIDRVSTEVGPISRPTPWNPIVIRTRDGLTQYTKSQVTRMGGPTKVIHTIIRAHSNGQSSDINESYVGVYSTNPRGCDSLPGLATSPDDRDILNSLPTAPLDSEERNWAVGIEVLMPITLTQSLRLVRGVEIDFCNQVVTLGADISLAILGDGYLDCANTSLCNVRVQPFQSQTAPILLFQMLPTAAGAHFGHVKFNTVANLTVADYRQQVSPDFDVIRFQSCGSRYVDEASVCHDFWSYNQSNNISMVRATEARCVIVLERREIWAGFINLANVMDVTGINCPQLVRLHWPNAENSAAVTDVCADPDKGDLGKMPQLNFSQFYFVRSFIPNQPTDQPSMGVFYIAGQGNSFEHIASVENGDLHLDMSFHYTNNWTYICGMTHLVLPTISGQKPLIVSPSGLRNVTYYDNCDYLGAPPNQPT